MVTIVCERGIRRLLMNQRKNHATKEKVTIACLHLDHGGIEMAVCSLSNALSEQGRPVEILSTYRLCEPVYRLDQRVKVTYLTDRKPNRKEFSKAVSSKNPVAIIRESLRAVRTLWVKYATMKRAIRNITEGTVISTRHEYSLLLSRFGNPGVKRIAQLHQDHGCSPKWIRKIARGYRNIDCLVVPTKQSADELRQLLQRQKSQLACLAIPHFLTSQGLPSREKKKQVIAVGRLHAEKGFERMLRVWGKISPLYPQFILKIVGEGQERSHLEERCRQLNLDSTVIFSGALPHEQVLEEMASSWCYLMTSLEESFGFVLIEAMSCGIPAIAFDVRTGPREIIQDGFNGYLLPDGEEEAMARRLATLLENQKRCEALGSNAKESAKRYEKDAILPKWMQLIES